jgi:hypothetical protein
MTWVATAVGAATALSAGASAYSASQQAGAAQSAANSQEQSATLQAELGSNVYNNNVALNQPQLESGGYALQSLDYMLGLTPNLNISPYFATPQINVNPNGSGVTTNWTGQGGTYMENELGNGSGTIAGQSYVNQTPMAGITAGSATPTNPGGVVTNPFASPNAQATGAAASNGMVPTPNGGMQQVIPAPTGSNLLPSAGGTLNITNTTGGAQPYTGSTNPFARYSGVPVAGNPLNDMGGVSPTSSMGGINPGGATGTYGSLMNPFSPTTFFQNPAYQFNMQQGQLALNRAAAAGGHLYSGAALQNAIQYASGMASNEYQNAYQNSLATQQQKYDMLAGAAGLAQTGTANVSNAGTNLTAAGTNALAGYGNAAAAGTIGSANAITNGINQTGSLLANYVMNPYGPYANPYGSVPNIVPNNVGNMANLNLNTLYPSGTAAGTGVPGG